MATARVKSETKSNETAKALSDAFANDDFLQVLGNTPPTPSTMDGYNMKRQRTGSISGRLRSASDLEEKGLINRYQKGILKDLIISGDASLQTALDKYEGGDSSELEVLVGTGVLNRRSSLDIDELELGYLNVDVMGSGPDQPFGVASNGEDEFTFNVDDTIGIGEGADDLDGGTGYAAHLMGRSRSGSMLGGLSSFGLDAGMTPPNPFVFPDTVPNSMQPPAFDLMAARAANSSSGMSFSTPVFGSQGDPSAGSKSKGGLPGSNSSNIKGPGIGGRRNSLLDGNSSMAMPSIKLEPTGLTQARGGDPLSMPVQAGGRNGNNNPGPGMHGGPGGSVGVGGAGTGGGGGAGLNMTTIRNAEDAEGGDIDVVGTDPPEAPMRYIGAYSPQQRRARIERFLEKRKKRVWTKKVKYDVRKNFADSRLRVKGRFVKKEDEELLRELMSMA